MKLSQKITWFFIPLLLATILAGLALSILYLRQSATNNIATVVQAPLNAIKETISNIYDTERSIEGVSQITLNQLLIKWLTNNQEPLASSPLLYSDWSVVKNNRLSVDYFSRENPPLQLEWFSSTGKATEIYPHIPSIHIIEPLEINGSNVGDIHVMVSLLKLQEESEKQYQKQFFSLLIASVCLFIVAVFSLFLIAHRTLLPLQYLTRALNELKKGNYLARLTYKKKDELCVLFDNFNLLGVSLDKKHRSQRRWLANISHELRTPITTLNCEIESLEDGLIEFDKRQLDSFSQEVKRLQYLVDDLYELSLSEAGGYKYKFTSLDISDCIKKVISSFDSRAKKSDIKIIYTADKDLIFKGDSKRIVQMFTNVIKNSLAYTNSPGAITISMHKKKDFIRVIIEDTPPAPKKDAEKLFDPFYRDANENSLNKGAGLGLTICRNIVEAHNGKINAKPSKFGGLCITIEFPTY